MEATSPRPWRGCGTQAALNPASQQCSPELSAVKSAALLHHPPRPHLPTPCKAHPQPPPPETFSSPHPGFTLTPWTCGRRRSVQHAGRGPRLPAHGIGAALHPGQPPAHASPVSQEVTVERTGQLMTNSVFSFHCRSENTKSGPHNPAGNSTDVPAAGVMHSRDRNSNARSCWQPAPNSSPTALLRAFP